MSFISSISNGLKSFSNKAIRKLKNIKISKLFKFNVDVTNPTLDDVEKLPEIDKTLLPKKISNDEAENLVENSLNNLGIDESIIDKNINTLSEDELKNSVEASDQELSLKKEELDRQLESNDISKGDYFELMKLSTNDILTGLVAKISRNQEKLRDEILRFNSELFIDYLTEIRGTFDSYQKPLDQLYDINKAQILSKKQSTVEVNSNIGILEELNNKIGIINKAFELFNPLDLLILGIFILGNIIKKLKNYLFGNETEASKVETKSNYGVENKATESRPTGVSVTQPKPEDVPVISTDNTPTVDKVLNSLDKGTFTYNKNGEAHTAPIGNKGIDKSTSGPSTWYGDAGLDIRNYWYNTGNAETATASNLGNAGFKMIWHGTPTEANKLNDNFLKPGDLLVEFGYDKDTSPTSRGCMWDGKRWVSDFYQRDAWAELGQGRLEDYSAQVWRLPSLEKANTPLVSVDNTQTSNSLDKINESLGSVKPQLSQDLVDNTDDFIDSQDQYSDITQIESKESNKDMYLVNKLKTSPNTSEKLSILPEVETRGGDSLMAFNKASENSISRFNNDQIESLNDLFDSRQEINVQLAQLSVEAENRVNPTINRVTANIKPDINIDLTAPDINSVV